MKRKQIIMIATGFLLFGALGAFGYYYMTQPNLRFINTMESDTDVAPNYVKIKTDTIEYTIVGGDADSGSNIITDMQVVQSQVEETKEIDELLSETLNQGDYSFKEPNIILNPYQNSPLSSVVMFQDEAKSFRVTVKGKEVEQNIVNIVEGTGDNIIPVNGLYPDYNNEVILEKLDENGDVTDSNTIYIKTDSLPDQLRNIVTVDKKTQEAAFELMMISGLDAPYLYAFDSNGDIRWYSTIESEYYGGYPLENGHFLIEASNVMTPTASSPHSSKFAEVDYLGRVYKEYYLPSGAHHDIQEKTPDGNLLIVTDSGSGYEQDAIMEIDRQTGELVKMLDLKDLFEGTGYVDTDDWAHINTCSYDESSNTVLISARNLHSVIKIDWETNEVIWILGNPQFWENTEYADKVLTAVGDIQWHYQQHTSYQIDADIDGNANTIHIMLYDNHNDANRTVDYFDDTNASYVKIYTINETDKTVTQDKIYESAYSKITSNFIMEYEKKRVFAISATIEEGDICGRIYEYDYDSGNVLNQYSIYHSFYRGYSIQLSSSSCMQEIDEDSNDYIGELRSPIKVDDKVSKPFRTLKADSNVKFSTSIMGDLLLVKARNHSYTQLIFKGNNNTYVYDISDLKCRLKNGYAFTIPIPLSGLEPDNYSIYGMFEDDYFNTGEEFTIQ